MKIAIVSDTHGNVANFKKIVAWVNRENIGTILHCGDIGDVESLKESLADFNGKFFGVLGNMDRDFKIFVEEYNKIPLGRSQTGEAHVKIEEKVLEIKIDNKFIAITHKPEHAKKLSESNKYDLVFYGHTHKPCLARRSSCLAGRQVSEGGGGENKECLLVNPGEVAGQFYKPTFAVYDTATEKLELKILEKL